MRYVRSVCTIRCTHLLLSYSLEHVTGVKYVLANITNSAPPVGGLNLVPKAFIFICVRTLLLLRPTLLFPEGPR